MLNEGITGEAWPAKDERNERLKQSADIIRQLLEGKTVTRKDLVKVEEAKLYTYPRNKVPIVGAAITPETAGWLADWADALITISQPKDKLNKVVQEWKENGGAEKPMILKVQLSYDTKREMALEGAYEQWKTNVFGSDMLSQLRTPQQLQQAAEMVDPDEVEEMVIISDDPGEFIQKIGEFGDMGFHEIVLHNVNKKQVQFIETFGKEVLPEFLSVKKI